MVFWIWNDLVRIRIVLSRFFWNQIPLKNFCLFIFTFKSVIFSLLHSHTSNQNKAFLKPLPFIHISVKICTPSEQYLKSLFVCPRTGTRIIKVYR
jgi:hypothetical protein